MNTLAFIGMAVLITASMAAVDFAHTRWKLALDGDAERVVPWYWRPGHVAGRWSVLQWAAASVGFVLSVKVTMYLVPFEGLGLYIGSVLGAKRPTPLPG